MILYSAIVSVLIALALLAIGHLHNELAALRRRHEALVLSVTHLAGTVGQLAGEQTLAALPVDETRKH